MINFKDCLVVNKDFGKYINFHIRVEGFYFWGDGYRNQKNKDDFDEMIDTLAKNLTDVISERYFGKLTFVEGDNNGTCAKIIPVDAHYEPSNVYLHPMDITGILQEADIDRLCEFINSWCRIHRPDCSAKITFLENTYHINDVDYINLIFENQENIINRVKEYLDKLSPKKRKEWLERGYLDVGFNFAETGRIKRDFGNSYGYSSSDPDVIAITHIVKLAIKNGQLK